MTERSKGIFAGCTETSVYILVVGPGVSRNSRFLREYGLRKMAEGYRRLFVDLARCDGMDSTFLGVFAGLALALKDSGKLSLVDLTGDSRQAFLDLGLDQLTSLETIEGSSIRQQFPPDALFQLLPGSEPNPQRETDPIGRAKLMLECHEYLCVIDERNEAKFHDVKEFLREDIARHKADHPDA